MFYFLNINAKWSHICCSFRPFYCLAVDDFSNLSLLGYSNIYILIRLMTSISKWTKFQRFATEWIKKLIFICHLKTTIFSMNKFKCRNVFIFVRCSYRSTTTTSDQRLNNRFVKTSLRNAKAKGKKKNMKEKFSIDCECESLRWIGHESIYNHNHHQMDFKFKNLYLHWVDFFFFMCQFE